MKLVIYHTLREKKSAGIKSFAVLIDPDRVTPDSTEELIDLSLQAKVDYFLVGGSLLIGNRLNEVVQQIKRQCSIPVILFPGNHSQVSSHADALLYLSLISGRNPEMLIGQHVVSAPLVKKSGLEIIPTGYMIIDGGVPTTVSYMSNAAPIPHDKDDVALCTAMAGEMLGMKLIYLDSGSGAKRSVSDSMIETVALNTSLPLLVGGGITDPEQAYLKCRAGADVIVVGNAIEKDVSLIREISVAVHSVPVKV